MDVIGAQVLHPDGHISPATVRIESGVITEIDDTVPARAGDLAGLTLLPGYVDLHCHGGGGGDYASTDPASIEQALSFHLRHGTTTTQASLVSAPMDQLRAQVASLMPFIDAGRVHGVHFEGPWLSAVACGALDPTTFVDATETSVERVVEFGGGALTMVTLAPEVPGAVAAIETLTRAGVVVAIGHTRATYAQTRAAIDAGARVATHLFNAMPLLHHRDPGPVGAMLADEHVTVELICDTVHLHPDVVRLAVQGAGDRAALVTDAIVAAGQADGEWRVGELEVVVRDGVARLRDGGALAGSMVTMEAAVRHAVLDCGIDLARASRAASLAPARALGLFDRGTIAHSMRADLVAVDTQLLVRRVMRAGHWID